MANLNEKQKMFVKEYLIDLNATQAAIRAGYSEKTAAAQASRLLTNVNIQAELNKQREKRVERVEITQDYVLNGIFDTTERCRQAVPVLDRQGNQVYIDGPDGQTVAAYVFDSKAALKGFELMGKHVGMFTGRQDDLEEPMPIKVDVTVMDGRRE